MQLFVIGICGVLGLAVGSFLNVVIWRVPNRAVVEDLDDAADRGDDAGSPDHNDADVDVRDLGQTPVEQALDAADGDPVPEGEPQPRRETIFWPASYCPHCQTPLKPYDNVPLVSWLVLRGKCRSCRTRIPARYPLVELANAILWVLVALVYWDRPELPAYLILVAGLLALSVIDLELKLLPTRIVAPLGGLVALGLSGAMVWESNYRAGLRALLAGLAAYVVIRLLYEVTRGRGIGYGDVRLSFVIGLALGWLGWGFVLGGLFVGFFLGALVGLVLLAFRIVDRRTPIPFGPFLAVGTTLFVLAGAPIIDWYLGI